MFSGRYKAPCSGWGSGFLQRLTQGAGVGEHWTCHRGGQELMLKSGLRMFPSLVSPALWGSGRRLLPSWPPAVFLSLPCTQSNTGHLAHPGSHGLSREGASHKFRHTRWPHSPSLQNHLQISGVSSRTQQPWRRRHPVGGRGPRAELRWVDSAEAEQWDKVKGDNSRAEVRPGAAAACTRTGSVPLSVCSGSALGLMTSGMTVMSFRLGAQGEGGGDRPARWFRRGS